MECHPLLESFDFAVRPLFPVFTPLPKPVLKKIFIDFFKPITRFLSIPLVYDSIIRTLVVACRPRLPQCRIASGLCGPFLFLFSLCFSWVPFLSFATMCLGVSVLYGPSPYTSKDLFSSWFCIFSLLAPYPSPFYVLSCFYLSLW